MKGMEEFVSICFRVLQYTKFSCFQLVALYEKVLLLPEYFLLEALSFAQFVRLHCKSLLQ